MNIFRKNIFLFFSVAVLLAPGFSNAEISFQSSQLPTPDGILNNLPQPLNDFVKSAKDISDTVGNQLGKYINTSAFQGPVNVNLNRLKDVSVTQWVHDISQSSLSNGFYQLAVKLFSSIGNLFIWILNIVIELIKQVLSLLR